MTAIRRPHRALAASAIAALALAPALLVTTPAAAATFPVHDEASFVAAIDAANLDPDPDIIEITADISLTAVAPTIDEPLTVRGGNHTIHDYSILESAGPDVGPALIAGAGNRVGLTAALLPLDHNGGPTRTRVPEPGSPAIDAGSPTFAAPPSTDQRGLARVQGGRIDIGAVEVVAALPATGRDAGAGWVWAALATLVAGGAVLVGGRGYQRSLR